MMVVVVLTLSSICLPRPSSSGHAKTDRTTPVCPIFSGCVALANEVAPIPDACHLRVSSPHPEWVKFELLGCPSPAELNSQVS